MNELWTKLKVRVGFDPPCEWVRDRFSEYDDFDLPQYQVAAIEGHIQRCAACREEWEAFEEVRALLGRAAGDPSYDPVEIERRTAKMLALIQAYEAGERVPAFPLRPVLTYVGVGVWDILHAAEESPGIYCTWQGTQKTERIIP